MVATALDDHLITALDLTDDASTLRSFLRPRMTRPTMVGRGCGSLRSRRVRSLNGLLMLEKAGVV